MKYFRLRDIKTPPFAYVVNRHAVIHSCDLCMMPFRILREPLRVEIFTTEVANWRNMIIGQPLMAEHWLIGDAHWVKALAKHVGSDFEMEPVEIVSWLSRSSVATSDSDQVDKEANLPEFFKINPIHSMDLDADLTHDYPPIECSECGRAISDVPIDIQLTPKMSDENPRFAYLDHLHLEGYDYLFSDDIASVLSDQFPTLILEPLEPEPLLF